MDLPLDNNKSQFINLISWLIMYWTKNATFFFSSCKLRLMLTSMLLHVMYVRDPFLHSMGACNTLWDAVLTDQSTKHAKCICWHADMQLIQAVMQIMTHIYSGLYFTGWLSSTLNYKGQNNATARNVLYVFHWNR